MITDDQILQLKIMSVQLALQKPDSDTLLLAKDIYEYLSKDSLEKEVERIQKRDAPKALAKALKE